MGIKITVCSVGITNDDRLIKEDHLNYGSSRCKLYNTELVKWNGRNDVEIIDLYDYIGDFAMTSMNKSDIIQYLPGITT